MPAVRMLFEKCNVGSDDALDVWRQLLQLAALIACDHRALTKPPVVAFGNDAVRRKGDSLLRAPQFRIIAVASMRRSASPQAPEPAP